MFPRTRRCLTGTRASPSVTARTSKAPLLADSQSWSQCLSGAPSQALPAAAATDRAPDDDNKESLGDNGTSPNETLFPTPQSEKEDTQQFVRKLLVRRFANLPRTRVDLARASLFFASPRSDNVATYKTAREALTQHGRSPYRTAMGQRKSLREGWRFHRSDIDWLPIARFLARIPQRTVPETVEVDREQIRAYTGSDRPNSWVESTGAGVHVELPSESASPRDTTTRQAVISGSPVYAAMVRAKHSKFVDMSVAADTLQPATPQNGLVSVDSVAKFNRFVYRLTNHHVNRLLEKEIYGDYNRYAADLLSKAFSDPRPSIYASTVALNRALLFLYNHSELLDAANLVYAHGSRMGLVHDVTTCNIRLKFAIRHNIEHLARATVREMLESRIQPNSQTWSMLYLAARTTDSRRQVVKIMKHSDTHMSTETWSRIASIMLTEQLQSAYDNTATLSRIMEQYDKTFGLEWFSAKVLQQALHVCKKRNLNRLARALLEAAPERGVTPLKYTHAYEFALFRAQGRLSEAVESFVSLVEKKEKIYMKLVIPYIFMTAWDRQRINVCCVLWMFAATKGLITRTMRTVVNRALLSNSNTTSRTEIDGPTKTQLRKTAWRRMAAGAIVGIEVETADADSGLVRYFTRLCAYFSRGEPSYSDLSTAEMVSRWTPDDGTRDEQISLAYVLLHRDLDAWKNFQSMTRKTLASLLRAAHDKDAMWYGTGYLNSLEDKDIRVLRQRCWQALQDHLPKKLDEREAADLSRRRQVILRDLDAFGLKSKDDVDESLLVPPSPSHPPTVEANNVAGTQTVSPLFDV